MHISYKKHIFCRTNEIFFVPLPQIVKTQIDDNHALREAAAAADSGTDGKESTLWRQRKAARHEQRQ